MLRGSRSPVVFVSLLSSMSEDLSRKVALSGAPCVVTEKLLVAYLIDYI